MKIISKCSDKALEIALENNKDGGYQQQIVAYDLLYKSCIRKKGL